MNIKIIFAFGILIFMGSCRKNIITVTPTATLILVNATAGGTTVKVNWTNVANKSTSQYYNQISTTVGYGANFGYGVLSGRPVPFTIVATTDTINPIFSANLNLSNGGIYSLYLAGKVGAVDTVFVH